MSEVHLLWKGKDCLMAKKKGTGVSPISNRIYYGTQDTEKHMWVG